MVNFSAIRSGVIYLGIISILMSSNASGGPRQREAKVRNARLASEQKVKPTKTQSPSQKSTNYAVRNFLEEALKIENASEFDLTLEMQERLKAISERADLTPELIKETLEKYFSPHSREALGKIFRTLGRTEYNNSAVLGQAGTGKSFLTDQIVAFLSFGVVPDFLKREVGLSGSGKMYEKLREAYLGQVDVIIVNTDLLSKNTSKKGEPHDDVPTRMQKIVNGLFAAAQTQFRAGGRRTIFLFDEVATLPATIKESLKKPLDKSGFHDPKDPFYAQKDNGFSAILMTTPNEWDLMVDGDSAVERRAKAIHLTEPSEEQAFRIVRNKADAEWQKLYGINISDQAIWAMIKTRKLLSNPPLAMPASVLAGTNDLFLNAVDYLPEHSNELSPEAVKKFIMQAAGLTDIWFEGPNGEPPMHDLAERVKELVFGQDELVDKIADRIKSWARYSFGTDIPVFIIGGPPGSGKDTIVRAFSTILFGHTSDHLTWGVGGAQGFKIDAILEGPPLGNHSDNKKPLFTAAIQEGPRSGFLVLNEVKDAPSDQIEKLKLPLERGWLRAMGRDSRMRLILYPVFLLGQWGEEQFVGLSDREIKRLMTGMSQKEIEAAVLKGKPDGTGAVPDAVADRARKAGGIYQAAPLAKQHYGKVVEKLHVKKMTVDFGANQNITLSVSRKTIRFIALVKTKMDLHTRELEALTRDFIQTAMSRAVDQGLGLYGLEVSIDVEFPAKGWKKAQIVVRAGKREWRFNAEDLYHSQAGFCEAVLTKRKQIK